MHYFLVALTFICRIAVGGLFIFSGLIKVNDLHGFAYKLIEYFHVFDKDFGFPGDFFAGLAFPIATLLAIVEVWLGLWLLLGFLSRLTTALLLALIVFFTVLTWYSWFFNAVQDCGCFGDFMKLTPYESFLKDLVLLVLIGFLFIQTARIRPVLGNRHTLLGVVLTLSAGVAVLSAVTLTSGPVVDMLGACKGCDFGQNTRDSAARKHIPNWVPLQDACGAQDEFKGYTLLLVVKNLDKLSEADARAMVETAHGLKAASGLQTFILTATVGKPKKAFTEAHKLQVCLTNQDETLLKTIIRCNRGALLLKDGVVAEKWVCTQPDAATVQALLGK
ncbi:MAG: DoxX family membrane protein [Bacteroidetes bacterium]|nr:DoxX family membrane protein [Bacteroidota bacterium]